MSQPSPGSNPGLSARTRPAAGFVRFGRVLALLAALLGGCASRTITVESEPPGALVYLDGRELGRTPLTAPFAHGGDAVFLFLHDEGIVRDGQRVTFAPMRVEHRLGSWWFDVFPFDALTSMTALHDEDHLAVVLVENDPMALLRVDQPAFSAALLDRAAATRDRARAALEEGWPDTPLLGPEVDGAGGEAGPATRPATGTDAPESGRP